MFCPECGTKAEDSDQFCSECGAPLSDYLEQEPESPSAESVAGATTPPENAIHEAAPPPQPPIEPPAQPGSAPSQDSSPARVFLRVGIALGAVLFLVIGIVLLLYFGNKTPSPAPDRPDPLVEVEKPEIPDKPSKPEIKSPPVADNPPVITPPPEKPTKPIFTPPPQPPAPPPDRLFDRWKITRQTVIADSSFPEAEIKKYWDQGYHISELAYGGGSWAVVMSQGLPITLQRYFGGGANFPEERVNEAWNEGYQITNFAYGNEWVVIMSKGTGLGQQSWMTRDYFPRDEISDYWDKGFRVTSMAYGNGAWAVTMSKNSGIGMQEWLTKHDTQTVFDHATELFNDKGYRFHSLDFGANSWAAIYSSNLPYHSQRYQVSRDWPAQKIQDSWDEGYQIVSLSFGGADMGFDHGEVQPIALLPCPPARDHE